MHDDRTVPTDLQSEAAELPTSTLATQGKVAPQAPGTPPEILAGYRRIRSLGAGGMGDVYLAEQLQLRRQVALKILRPGAGEAFSSRFLREAKTMAAVTHPHVVAIHDAGEAEGFLYMALELVTGGDLNKLLKTRGRLEEREVLRLIIGCCRGLEAIEAAGLIHRDIKPANIFLTRDGQPKIGDLGLARQADGDDRMTLTGHSWGTPAYMSPEQVRGEADLDIRSDLYSLGATMFCLLTGHPPFQGGTSYVITTAVLTQTPPDVRQFNRTVSPAVAAIIRTTLAKDRRQRHPTPAALRVDCERALAAMPLAFAAVPDAPPKEAPAPTPTVVVPPHLGRNPGSGLNLDPAVIKILAYGSGITVLGLVIWSLSGETSMERPNKKVGNDPTLVTSTVKTSAPWMTAEGRDEFGPWAIIDRDGFHQRFRLIPAGTFRMGSPTLEPGHGPSETLHEVTLSAPRWMAETEMTRRSWGAITSQDPGPQPDLPIVGVSWYEVRDFLKHLNELGIPARLPTEAEWEQGSRAGSEAPYTAGEQPDPREWLGQPSHAGPRPPDTATANRLGLADMAGNVQEWVEDAWDGRQIMPNHATTDPCETFGGLQVVRGGAWDTAPQAARNALRQGIDPQVRNERIGFRVVISP